MFVSLAVKGSEACSNGLGFDSLTVSMFCSGSLSETALCSAHCKLSSTSNSSILVSPWCPPVAERSCKDSCAVWCWLVGSSLRYRWSSSVEFRYTLKFDHFWVDFSPQKDRFALPSHQKYYHVVLELRQSSDWLKIDQQLQVLVQILIPLFI
jgi:hypothetical protein